MNKKMTKGAYTLLITPWNEKGALDQDGLKLLVERQVAVGIHGIAPLGVTGENTLLTDAEELKVLEIVAKTANGKCKVVPDTCSSSLWRAKEKVKAFADLGADYISVFSPFFILPKAEGIIKFYEQLADVSPVPILLHNSKDRTCVEIDPGMTALLSKHPNIVGIKDGNKGLDHLTKVILLTKDEDFCVFTGKDTTAFPLLSFGGAGSFTVAGNIVPEVMKEMIDLALAGKMEQAQNMHYEYYPLFEALRWETNPMSAKRALNLMGLPAGGLRLPLTPLSEDKTSKLHNILHKKGIIK
ncbi:MAG TPA: 4-hydroxy-tetrahydrodipicolinate synthase [Bacteroidales bacterium]|nr:4-hydroxy-tetrahydrodipicolinate synthase [Bacteroidales bacterium]HNZ44026.1 4-hydroxy-tetrahydrodipicolinate synthase [Bacteroidales bacterium]HPI29929.1 4-hydroxy-tetrahydrodipicolinate synthase [Bacteroidales bacterium]